MDNNKCDVFLTQCCISRDGVNISSVTSSCSIAEGVVVVVGSSW